jgi:hypothetical protein
MNGATREAELKDETNPLGITYDLRGHVRVSASERKYFRSFRKSMCARRLE